MFEPLLGIDALADAEERRKPSRNYHRVLTDRAISLYEARCRRATLRRLFAWFLGSKAGLFELSRLPYAGSSQHYIGMQTVPLAAIRGSEGRARDFDLEFNPRQNGTRGRWIAIALAHLRGECLPPVSLIKVGDVYFVRDGHHRISVARALGQQYIEAEVTVFQVPPPWPWQKAGSRAGAKSRARAGAELGIRTSA